MKDTNYISFYNFYKPYSENVHLSFKGPLDKNVIAVMGDLVNRNLGQNKVQGKLIFSVFIELALNISYYSDEFVDYKNPDKRIGVGIVIISEYSNYYTITTGNVVSNHNIKKIIDKCNTINSMNRDELRRIKRDMRRLPSGTHGGSNIGLIQVALTSENPLHYDVSRIDESNSFFSILVTINK